MDPSRVHDVGPAIPEHKGRHAQHDGGSNLCFCPVCCATAHDEGQSQVDLANQRQVRLCGPSGLLGDLCRTSSDGELGAGTRPDASASTDGRLHLLADLPGLDEGTAKFPTRAGSLAHDRPVGHLRAGIGRELLDGRNVHPGVPDCLHGRNRTRLDLQHTH